MKVNRLSAKELTVMASLAGINKLYGVQDGFTTFPLEERHRAMMETADELLSKGISEMDFDGQYSLAEAYREPIGIIFGCEECVILNYRDHESSLGSYVFWRQGDKFLLATSVNEEYELSPISKEEVRTMIPMIQIPAVCKEISDEFLLPLRCLVKAKRSCANGDEEEAVRILKQMGVPLLEAYIIVDALMERSKLVRIVYVNNREPLVHIEENLYLMSGRGSLTAEQTIENLCTCMRFSGVDEQFVSEKLNEVVNRFTM